MALFGMFAIDDLARLAVKKLAQHQETKAIADSIAHDFKDMGVAFAAGTPSSVTPEAPPDPKTIGLVCKGKVDAYGPATNPKECADAGCQKYYHGGQQQSDCERIAESYA